MNQMLPSEERLRPTGLEGQDSHPPGEQDVFFEFREVSKAFAENVVLNRVRFTVRKGETCVIMGRSGVGKSVTLKHILGFLKPDSGRIIIEGQDVTDFTEKQFEEVRRKVTMVFQSGALFDSLTVAENIAFPLQDEVGLTTDDLDAYVRKLAHLLEVEDVLDRLPGELSTGVKRAVAMARALAQNPQAILYDEPTTMVDPIMAGYMGDLISRLKSAFRKTAIVVTHDTHLAKKLADSVVFLQEGKASVFNSWEEFAHSSDPFIRNFILLDELVPALDVNP